MQNEINNGSSRRSFRSIQNKLKLHHQKGLLGEIVDRAGSSLREAQQNGMLDDEAEIRHIIGGATFMISTLGFIIAEGGKEDMESAGVDEIIQQAEAMTAIMSGAFFHYH